MMQETAERAARRDQSSMGVFNMRGRFSRAYVLILQGLPGPLFSPSPFFSWQWRPFISQAMTGELKQPSSVRAWAAVGRVRIAPKRPLSSGRMKP